MAIFVVVRDRDRRIVGVIKRNATPVEFLQQLVALRSISVNAPAPIEVINAGRPGDLLGAYTIPSLREEIRRASYLTTDERRRLLDQLDLEEPLGLVGPARPGGVSRAFGFDEPGRTREATFIRRLADALQPGLGNVLDIKFIDP